MSLEAMFKIYLILNGSYIVWQVLNDFRVRSWLLSLEAAERANKTYHNNFLEMKKSSDFYEAKYLQAAEMCDKLRSELGGLKKGSI